MNFCEKIKELRKEKGLTQKELADKLQINFKNIGAWEQRRAEPCIADICLLADFFGCATDELLGHELHEKPIDKQHERSFNTLKTVDGTQNFYGGDEHKSVLKIAELRKRMGLTQTQLSVALGMSVKKLAAWEQNRAEPCVSDISLLADFFEVTIDELFGRKNRDVVSVDIKDVELFDEEKLLTDMYRVLSLHDRAELVGFAKGLVRYSANHEH